MSADEPVRLRLHRRLSELLDSELADAIMESMPPMPWDQLATKDDIARLDTKTDRLEDAMVAGFGRLSAEMTAQGEHLEGLITAQNQRIDAQGEHLEGLITAQNQRINAQGERLEGLITAQNQRIDAQGERLEGLITAQNQRIDAQGEQLTSLIGGESRVLAGEVALLEGRLSVRYAETTRMIVFAMMTLFVGVVAVMVTTVS